jgi:TolB-like protein
VNQSTRGVFLSYASDDAGAAKHICDALRAAGIEVWFDQSELRGGDAWDQKIRRQIRDCALFVPIISAHTQARPEGYFRLEWKLAVDRSHLMAAERAFLVPVVVDATTEPAALVPAPFRAVQWTRIEPDKVRAAFVDRIAALLNQRIAVRAATPERGTRRAPPGRLAAVAIVLCVAAVVAFAIATAIRGGGSSHSPGTGGADGAAAASVTTAPAVISEKSVAVLPFEDLSEKHDQEYFASGLSEELIDLLARTPELHVPARTSSSAFRTRRMTIAEVARTLNVAYVLEGSVRKSGDTLRVTANLVRAADGYQVWSQTFERKPKDVFKVQDEIAAAVSAALNVHLLARQVSARGISRNPDAYDLLLRGRFFGRQSDHVQARDAYQRAVDWTPPMPWRGPGWRTRDK